MIAFLLLLALSGVATAALYKKPAARAATVGGLRAGAAQADVEFRKGFAAARTRYDQAQKYLTRPTASGDPPSPRNLRWWTSVVFALTGGTAAAVAGGTYGLLKVLGGAARVGKQAAAGARKAYRDYKDTKEIEEADVVEEEETEDDTPAPEKKHKPAAAAKDDREDQPTTDLTPYDILDERTTVNAEFTSFPQLMRDHATAGADMTQVAAAIDGQVAGLVAKNMGHGELLTTLMAAQETANMLALQHEHIANLAAAQGAVAEAHAAVGGPDNVADKEAYAQG
ncbi:hypothetical protein ACQP25_17425 [Microtetraspora malaysiensis]|uniref:hypothetical protein n=1 Tax=Microtetraspora malaysiensis TaxID=161358 RepID=UPI003D9172B9